MKGPALVRVDDRLIHGQVVTAWVTALKCTNIVIVDDGVANDSFLSEVVRMAAPASTTVTVLSQKQALDDTGVFSDALVLVKNPLVALGLKKAGIEFDRLILGGMGASPGRKTVYRNISASAAELSALKELQDLGVECVFQIVPGDKPHPFSKIGANR